MIDAITLRQSDLSTFLHCERQFYLRYVRRHAPIKPEQGRPCKNHSIGTMGHHLYAGYYDGDLDGTEGAEHYTEMLRAFAIANLGAGMEVDGETVLGPGTNPKLTWEKGIEYAVTAMQGYPGWVAESGHDLRYQVIGTEYECRVTIEVDGVQVTLVGHFDLLLYDELLHSESIVDHKFFQYLKPPRPNEWQLYTYGALRLWETGNVPEAACLNVTKRSLQTAKATGPFYDRFPVPLGEMALVAHQRKLIELIRRVLRFLHKLESKPKRYNTIALANQGLGCNMCALKEVCDNMDDGSDWESLADKYYPPTTDDVDFDEDMEDM